MILFNDMPEQGVAANEYVYTALIDACAKRMDIQTADRIMDAALRDGTVKPNVQMFTALIDMNARAGRARKVKTLWVSD
jgi:pentatricopeptide repeat protein